MAKDGAAELLLLCALCQQIATNLSLSRERSVELANTDANELWRHLGRRYILVVLLGGGIMAAAGSKLEHVLSVALICGLAAVSVASHSASQIRPNLVVLRPLTLASGLILGLSFPLLCLSPLLLATVVAATSTILAARLYYLIGPARGSGVDLLPASGSWSRLMLWLAGLATGEYDRYLFAAKDSSDDGVQYGLLWTALVLPLTVSIVVGPRLSAKLLSNKIRMALISVVSVYCGLLIFIASTLLSSDQISVFAGSAIKTIILVACADLYFYAMARNSTEAVAFNTASTAVSSLGTLALLGNYELAAALLRVLGGVGFMLSLVWLLRRKSYQ